MTSEEILIRLGVDNSSLQKGLKDAKGFAADAGKSIASAIMSPIGALFSTAAIGATFAGLSGMAKSLRLSAEAAGVSSEFFQVWSMRARRVGVDAESAEKFLDKLVVKIGQARLGSAEASGEFQKYGISLTDTSGHAKSTEEIVRSIADVINNTGDAAKRAAIEFAFFGKSSIALGEMLKSGSKGFDDFIGKNKALIYTQQELRSFEGAKTTGNIASKLGGRILGEALRAFGPTGALGEMKEFERFINNLKNPKVDQEDIDPEKQKALNSALDKLREARRQDRMQTMSPDQKVNALLKERVTLIQVIHSLEEGSLAQIEAKIQLTERNKEIEKEVMENAKKHNEETSKRLKEQEEFLEKSKHSSRELVDLLRQQRYDDIGAISDKMSPYMPTIEDLAKSGSWSKTQMSSFTGWQFNQGPYAKTAQEILRLQSDAHDSIMWGNTGRAKGDADKIKDLKEYLVGQGVQTPDMHLESINKNSATTAEKIAAILVTFQTGKAKFIPVNGE